MKVWVVPYAYEEHGVDIMALQGVQAFDNQEKAEEFVEELKKEHHKRLDLFIQHVEVK